MADDPAETPLDSFEFPLIKPIKAHAETVSTLNFRKPTGEDILKVGNPCSLDFNHEPPLVRTDDVKMMAMICRLANIPPSSVIQIDTGDLSTISLSLSRFFLPRMQKLF